MKCPNCGAENPEHALYCGRCAAWIGEPRQSVGGPEAISLPRDPLITSAPFSPLQAGDSLLRWAVVAAAAGFALFALGLALYAYYTELFIHHLESNLGDIDFIANIGKMADSTSALGGVFAVLGLVLIYQGVTARLKHADGSVLVGQLHLTRIKFLTVAAFVIVLVTALAKVWMDSGNTIGYGTQMRIYYLSTSPWVILAGVLLLTAVDLAKKPEAQRSVTPAMKYA